MNLREDKNVQDYPMFLFIKENFKKFHNYALLYIFLDRKYSMYYNSKNDNFSMEQVHFSKLLTQF
jgi:hypothetical protein